MIPSDLNNITDEEWTAFTLAKTQIADILKAMYDFPREYIGGGAYYLYYMTKDANHPKTEIVGRLPVELGDETEAVRKTEQIEGFVRWATVADRERWGKAFAEGMRKHWQEYFDQRWWLNQL